MLVITRGYYRYLSLLRCSDHFWPIRTVNLTENSLVHERAFSTSLRPCDIAAWSDCFHSPCDGHIYIYIIYLLGMIPLINHDSSEGEQWGRDEIYPDIWNQHLSWKKPCRKNATSNETPQSSQIEWQGPRNPPNPQMVSPAWTTSHCFVWKCFTLW